VGGHLVRVVVQDPAYAAFPRFAALWVNGNIPHPAALATSYILGLATFLAMGKADPPFWRYREHRPEPHNPSTTLAAPLPRNSHSRQLG